MKTQILTEKELQCMKEKIELGTIHLRTANFLRIICRQSASYSPHSHYQPLQLTVSGLAKVGNQKYKCSIQHKCLLEFRMFNSAQKPHFCKTPVMCSLFFFRFFYSCSQPQCLLLFALSKHSLPSLNAKYESPSVPILSMYVKFVNW